MEHQNLWDTTKAVVKVKFMTLIAYLRKEQFKINLSFILRNQKIKSNTNPTQTLQEN